MAFSLNSYVGQQQHTKTLWQQYNWDTTTSMKTWSNVTATITSTEREIATIIHQQQQQHECFEIKNSQPSKERTNKKNLWANINTAHANAKGWKSAKAIKLCANTRQTVEIEIFSFLFGWKMHEFFGFFFFFGFGKRLCQLWWPIVKRAESTIAIINEFSEQIDSIWFQLITLEWISYPHSHVRNQP